MSGKKTGTDLNARFIELLKKKKLHWKTFWKKKNWADLQKSLVLQDWTTSPQGFFFSLHVFTVQKVELNCKKMCKKVHCEFRAASRTGSTQQMLSRIKRKANTQQNGAGEVLHTKMTVWILHHFRLQQRLCVPPPPPRASPRLLLCVQI